MKHLPTALAALAFSVFAASAMAADGLATGFGYDPSYASASDPANAAYSPAYVPPPPSAPLMFVVPPESTIAAPSITTGTLLAAPIMMPTLATADTTPVLIMTLPKELEDALIAQGVVWKAAIAALRTLEMELTGLESNAMTLRNEESALRLKVNSTKGAAFTAAKAELAAKLEEIGKNNRAITAKKTAIAAQKRVQLAELKKLETIAAFTSVKSYLPAGTSDENIRMVGTMAEARVGQIKMEMGM